MKKGLLVLLIIATSGCISKNREGGESQSFPEASFVQTSQTVSEGAGAASFTVEFDEPFEQSLSVPFEVSGSADTTDHDLINGVLTIPAGERRVTREFTVYDEAHYERLEDVVVTLIEGEIPLGDNITHRITIEDNDDQPELNVSQRFSDVSESGGRTEFNVTLSAQSYQNIFFQMEVTGTASTDDHDFGGTTMLMFTAGQTSMPIVINTIDDNINEGNEVLTLTANQIVNAFEGTYTRHRMTILDDDMPTTTTVSLGADTTLLESAGAVLVTVTATPPADIPLTIPVTINTGTSTADAQDHNLPSSFVLTLAANQPSANRIMQIIDDPTDEPSETVNLQIGSVTNAGIGDGTQTITINDNDGPSLMFFSATTGSTAESAGTYSAQLTLNRPSGFDITAQLSTQNITANAGDFTLQTPSVTIPKGEMTANVLVSITDDTAQENNEQFRINIGAVNNGNAGAPTSHTVTIDANDVPNLEEVRFLSASGTAGEQTGVTSIGVQLTGVTTQNVSVPFTVQNGSAIQGLDFQILTPSPINIPAGSATRYIAIQLINDTAFENTESFQINLGTPTNANLGAPSTFTMNITDDDNMPVANFVPGTVTLNEPSTGNLQVNLSQNATTDVTIPFTVTGTASNSDYNMVAGAVTIPEGSNTGTAFFSVINDTVFENTETLIFTMTGPAIGATIGTNTTKVFQIQDDDLAPVSYFLSANQAQTVTEGPSPVTIRVHLDATAERAVTIPFVLSGTANSNDHNLTATSLTIAPGEFSNTLDFVVDDTAVEPTETLILTLQSSPTNRVNSSNNRHTMTIEDNDATPLMVRFQLSNSTVMEGSSTVLYVYFDQNINGSAAYQITGGTANGSDHSLAASGNINIMSGTGTIFIPTIDDSVEEPDETLQISLVPSAGVTVGSPAVHNLTIIDNDDSGDLTDGQIAFRDFVWPHLRGEVGGFNGCVACHGTSAGGRDPFASANLMEAYTAAIQHVPSDPVERQNINEGNTFLLQQSRNNHCSNPTLCEESSSSPLQANIQIWMDNETSFSTSESVFEPNNPNGTIALKTMNQYFHYLMRTMRFHQSARANSYYYNANNFYHLYASDYLFPHYAVYDYAFGLMKGGDSTGSIEAVNENLLSLYAKMAGGACLARLRDDICIDYNGSEFGGPYSRNGGVFFSDFPLPGGGTGCFNEPFTSDSQRGEYIDRLALAAWGRETTTSEKNQLIDVMEDAAGTNAFNYFQRPQDLDERLAGCVGVYMALPALTK